jgi:molybdate/tungstate transport system permease protein
MSSRYSLTRILFSLLGSLLVIFIILPIVTTFFATPLVEVARTFSDAEALSSIGITLIAALIATIAGTVFGIPLAYMLANKRFFGKRAVEAVVDLPIVIPHTAAGIALLMVFGSHGTLGAGLAKLGWYFTDTLSGTVVAMLFISVPYLVNFAREGFESVDKELESNALVDGANRWQMFWKISLPLAWRSVMAGMVMMWARGISEFGAVIILAYHPTTVPTLILERFQGFGLKAAQPLAFLFILLILLIFVLILTIFAPTDYRKK